MPADYRMAIGWTHRPKVVFGFSGLDPRSIVIWNSCLDFAALHYPADGCFHGLTLDRVAKGIQTFGIPHADVVVMLRDLIRERFIDETPDGYAMHDWADHQGHLVGLERKRAAGRKGGKQKSVNRSSRNPSTQLADEKPRSAMGADLASTSPSTDVANSLADSKQKSWQTPSPASQPAEGMAELALSRASVASPSPLPAAPASATPPGEGSDRARDAAPRAQDGTQEPAEQGGASPDPQAGIGKDLLARAPDPLRSEDPTKPRKRLQDLTPDERKAKRSHVQAILTQLKGGHP